MKPIAPKVVSKTRKLRKNGLSQREITKRLNIGLGTVWKYTCDIKLSAKQKQKLQMQTCLGASYFLRKKWGKRGGKQTSFRVKHTKETLIMRVIDFYIKNGRIPTKREFSSTYRAYLRVFGTWNNAIKIAGFTPNTELFAKKWKAKDGHICDSLSEKIIDDYLYRRNVKHKINVKYPGNYGFTVDFKVGKYWIEFFGLNGQHHEYDRLKEKKLTLVKKYNLKLIAIYPEDLQKNLDKIFLAILK